MLSYLRTQVQRAFPAALGAAIPVVCSAACALVFAAAESCGPPRPAEHATDGSAERTARSAAPSADASSEPPLHPAGDDVEVPPAP